MSVFSDLMSESGFPLLVGQLGESVTRYTSAGVSSTVSAIVADMDAGGLEIVTDASTRRIRVKTLQVAASQTLAITDQWDIEGERWATTGITDAHDGMRVVTVQWVKRTKNEKSPPRGS